MRHIHIRTFAYNAEKTISRAIESILNQTYPYFTYYLLDNGSTDSTRSIIKQYALTDPRIIPFYTDKNLVFNESHDRFVNLTCQIGDEELYCVLDADDQYTTDFFEKAICFLEYNNLDLVCCGSRYIFAPNGRNAGSRSLSKNIILNREDFADSFPFYFQYFRPVWGKLMKGKCIRDFVNRRDPDDESFPDYGIDTWNMMLILKHTDIFGILAGTSHDYYLSPKSSSYRLSKKRIISDKLLIDAIVDFLTIFGNINARNMDFTYMVYLNAIKDTWTLIQNGTHTLSDKLRNLNKIANCIYTKQLASYVDFGHYINEAATYQAQRKDFFLSIANWLLSLDEIPESLSEQFLDTAEFCCAAAEYSNGWLTIKKLRIQYLLEYQRISEAMTKFKELKEFLSDDEASVFWSCVTERNGY